MASRSGSFKAPVHLTSLQTGLQLICLGLVNTRGLSIEKLSERGGIRFTYRTKSKRITITIIQFFEIKGQRANQKNNKVIQPPSDKFLSRIALPSLLSIQMIRFKRKKLFYCDIY